MSLVSALSLIVFIIIIYSFLAQFYSLMFRITGISKEKAKFQSISLLTNAGYTTGESEIITSDNSRRRIAKAAMLTGYFFSVVIVSLFINLFLSIDFSHVDKDLLLIATVLASLIGFFLFLQIPAVKRLVDRLIEKLASRAFTKVTHENYISVLDSYGEDAVCKVLLLEVPSILKNRMISETDVRKLYNINILMYERKNKVHYVTRDTIFTDGDSLLCFGRLENIKELFLKSEKLKKSFGEEASAHHLANEIVLIENYGYQVLAEVSIATVPSVLYGKTLFESRIKDYFSINVMMISRNGSPVPITKDSVIEKGDTVLVFGPLDAVNSVFD